LNLKLLFIFNISVFDIKTTPFTFSIRIGITLTFVSDEVDSPHEFSRLSLSFYKVLYFIQSAFSFMIKLLVFSLSFNR